MIVLCFSVVSKHVILSMFLRLIYLVLEHMIAEVLMLKNMENKSHKSATNDNLNKTALSETILYVICTCKLMPSIN